MKEHSTRASFRLHQFLRLVLILLCLIILITSASAGGVAGASLSVVTVLSAIAGIVSAEILDWIMWYVCEWLVGE